MQSVAEIAAGLNVALQTKPLNVYQCIAAVSADLARSGISKDRQNEQQHYKFRGIDDVYQALAPALVRYGLVILPRVLSRTCTERQTQKGGVIFSVVTEVLFEFVSVHDGSRHGVTTIGEATDTADKATNKAMSAAYKYAAFMTFCIPTEGSGHDADEVTPEPVVAKAPAGFEDWLIDLESVADSGTEALRKAWKVSQPYMRKHLTDTQPDKIDALKLKAERAMVLA